MYPDGFATSVHVGGPLTESLEGASRPSHFDGVAVIVTKLLGVVQPDVLFLGEKDAQQLAVVRRFVRDLDLPVEVAGVPTLREPDGLAMSSRNVYLTPEQRAVAPDLYRALLAGAAAAGAPGATAKDVVVAATSALLLPDGRRSTPTPSTRLRRRPALRARLPRRRRRRHVRPRGRPRAALAARRRGPPRLHPSHRQHLRSPARTPPRTRPHERKDHHGDRHRQRHEEGPRARGPRVRHHRLHRVRQPRRRRHDQDHRRGQPRPCARPASATAPSPCSCPAPPAP